MSAFGSREKGTSPFDEEAVLLDVGVRVAHLVAALTVSVTPCCFLSLLDECDPCFSPVLKRSMISAICRIDAD